MGYEFEDLAIINNLCQLVDSPVRMTVPLGDRVHAVDFIPSTFADVIAFSFALIGPLSHLIFHFSPSVPLSNVPFGSLPIARVFVTFWLIFETTLAFHLMFLCSSRDASLHSLLLQMR